MAISYRGGKKTRGLGFAGRNIGQVLQTETIINAFVLSSRGGRVYSEKTERTGFIFRPFILIFDRILDIADESKTVSHFFKLENGNMQFFIMEIKTLFCGKCLNAFFSIFYIKIAG